MTELVLHVFPPLRGLPSASPFSTKALILMEMTGLPYEARHERDPRGQPKGKLPVLRDGDEVIPDSHFIRRHLEARHGAEFDAGLSEAERATSAGMIALAEDRLYFVAMAERWLHPENQASLPELFAHVPGALRGLVARLVIRSVRRDLHGQGTGRHGRDEALEIARTAIDAFAGQLGGKPFLMGEAPTGADASVYPMLIGSRSPAFRSALRGMVEGHPSLVAYCDRMAARFPLPTGETPP